jgi:hypothetical protein
MNQAWWLRRFSSLECELSLDRTPHHYEQSMIFASALLAPAAVTTSQIVSDSFPEVGIGCHLDLHLVSVRILLASGLICPPEN